jgi:cell division transport system permease protein
VSTWLRLHRHAFTDAWRRVVSQPLGAAFSVLVLAVAIALPVLAAIAVRSLGAVTSGVETDPHVNVYLALDATDEDARRVGDALRAHPATAGVKFIPRSEALEELKASTHLAELLANLDRNPLPDAFTVRVRSADPVALARAREAWLKLPKVDQVNADFEWAQRLGRWVRFANRLVALIALGLGCAVAFIVGHLIRLQVVSQRQEIEVSQLIGATAADVRRPFLYHGLLQGLLAGLVALLLSWAVTTWVSGELQALTASYETELKLVFLTLRDCIAILGLTAVLGLVGAWWAVGREIRRFSPSA